GAGNTVTYTQGGAPVVASPAIAVADAGSATLVSASVSISGGFLAGDKLAARTAGTGIVAIYDAGSGVLTLSGVDTLAHYQAVLDSVTFSSGSANPTNAGTDVSRTLTWQVNDGTLSSPALTSTVDVTEISAPLLAGAGNTVSYRQGGAPVAASPMINVADVESTTLASASVTISGGFFVGDVLAAVTTGTAIAANFSATTHALTLTGSDTVAHYQQVLDSVTFSSTSADPTNSGADVSRTLSWQVKDVSLSSNTVTSTVSVTKSSAPLLTGAGSGVTFTQNGGPVSAASPALTVSDTGSTTLASASVTISGGFFAGDTLAATAVAGIAVSYNTVSGVLSLSGTASLANYQTVLDSVTFSSTSANPTNGGADPSRTLTWQASDGTLASNTVRSTVTVVGVGPVLAGAGNTVSYTQGGAAVIASPAISATDAAALNLASASVAISAGYFAGDTLTALTTGTGITASFDASTGILSLDGSATPAIYQQVLRTVAFHSVSVNPTNGGTDTSRTLSWQVNDGTLNSHTVTSTVTVVGTAHALAPASIASAPASIASAPTSSPSGGLPTASMTMARSATPTASVPASATPTKPLLANARLSMGSTSAAAGASVTVPVRIDSAVGLHSMHLMIRYDARALTPVTVERSALTAGFAYTAGVVEPGLLRIEAASQKPLPAGGGELFGLKFALAATAAGTLRIDFASARLNDARLMARDPNAGAIIVKARTPQPAAPPAGAKPAISLTQPARSFELGSSSKTHAWLDDFLKPGEGKNGKANSWTVEVKRRTLH
ncbi:MAG TPA: hypothetical protein VNZ53_18495, partial [Steroidobacteraceae bacterium]|nr:hypothetical protein [Steroidobacteraceae bacterium]